MALVLETVLSDLHTQYMETHSELIELQLRKQLTKALERDCRALPELQRSLGWSVFDPRLMCVKLLIAQVPCELHYYQHHNRWLLFVAVQETPAHGTQYPWAYAYDLNARIPNTQLYEDPVANLVSLVRHITGDYTVGKG